MFSPEIPILHTHFIWSVALGYHYPYQLSAISSAGFPASFMPILDHISNILIHFSTLLTLRVAFDESTASSFNDVFPPVSI